MKKRILLSIIMLCIIVCSATMVYASTGKVDLLSNQTSVKPGDTFTVTISATCEDGINGITTTYSYDEDKLELVSAKVANNNWVKVTGTTNYSIDVFCDTTSKITSDSIYVLTFKVKDTITTETTANVTISTIKVDSDVDASSFTEDGKSVNISIVPLNTNPPDNNDNDDDNTNVPDDNKGDNNTSNPEQNNENNTTNTPSQNKGDTNNNNTNNNKPSQNNGANKDNTTSNKPIPQTGENNSIWMLFVGAILLGGAVYSFIRIKNKK